MFPQFSGVGLLDDHSSSNPRKAVCRGVTRRSSAGRFSIWWQHRSGGTRGRAETDRRAGGGAGDSSPGRGSCSAMWYPQKAVRGDRGNRAGRLPVQLAIRVLGVSESGYYEWRGRAPRRVRCGMRGWPGRSRPCIWPPGGDPWILAGPGRTHLGLGITVGHGAVEMLGDGSRPSR